MNLTERERALLIDAVDALRGETREAWHGARQWSDPTQVDECDALLIELMELRKHLLDGE